MSCCVVDSLVDNNLLAQLPVVTGEHEQRSVTIFHQLDAYLAHFLRQNLPSGRSSVLSPSVAAMMGRKERDVAPWYERSLMVRWVVGSILHGVDPLSYFSYQGARCSSVVRAFAHGAMGRRIDPSWGGPTELFLVPRSEM